MLEDPVDPPLLAQPMGSNNAGGAENQQERPDVVVGVRNPQRPYAGPLPPTRERMRWSDTHGDVGNRNVQPVHVQPLGNSDITDASEIPCRVNGCPSREQSRESIPLITANPSPSVSLQGRGDRRRGMPWEALCLFGGMA